MLLVIDNYDSFTFNLVQGLGELGAEMVVARNDRITADDIMKLGPNGIVISPGPCTPKEAGISVSVVKQFHTSTPILGVCLGHQSIAEGFNGRVIKAPSIVHGKTTQVFHTGNGVLRGVENPFVAARYHSLIIDRESMPDVLEVTAWSNDGLVMGVRHRTRPVFGVQFHPESIATPAGKTILKNFLEGNY